MEHDAYYIYVKSKENIQNNTNSCTAADISMYERFNLDEIRLSSGLDATQFRFTHFPSDCEHMQKQDAVTIGLGIHLRGIQKRINVKITLQIFNSDIEQQRGVFNMSSQKLWHDYWVVPSLLP